MVVWQPLVIEQLRIEKITNAQNAKQNISDKIIPQFSFITHLPFVLCEELALEAVDFLSKPELHNPESDVSRD